jgi:DcuC family C4-dicarboxylate transporter
MVPLLSFVVVVLAALAVIRRFEVRLILLGAALLLGWINGDVTVILKAFFTALTSERFIIPICCCLGFAYVLRETHCDEHLVRFLARPLQRARLLLIPGAVLVGFLVNIPIVSQTSTALAVGTVLVPLLLRAGVPAATIGASLVLGSSMGGELFNPGAPELLIVASRLKINSADCVHANVPFVLIYGGVTLVVFWLLSAVGDAQPKAGEGASETADAGEAHVRVVIWKAIMPLVPLAILFLAGPPLNVIAIPPEWLLEAEADPSYFGARLIGAAMLIGTLLAALTERRKFGRTAAAFFEGAGYGFTHVISLIVVAQCFGEGIKMTGVAQLIGDWSKHQPGLLIPLAALAPLAFAALGGSAIASTTSLYQFFVEPARQLGYDPIQIGALVCIGAAAGRTLSPVAAVMLMSAKLTDTQPLELCRRVAAPLLVGILVMIVVAQFLLTPNALGDAVLP